MTFNYVMEKNKYKEEGIWVFASGISEGSGRDCVLTCPRGKGI
jgi:hypothetical protein